LLWTEPTTPQLWLHVTDLIHSISSNAHKNRIYNSQDLLALPECWNYLLSHLLAAKKTMKQHNMTERFSRFGTIPACDRRTDRRTQWRQHILR